MYKWQQIAEDFAQIATSAFDLAGGAKDEAKQRFKQHAEALLRGMDLVTRQEFQVAQEMIKAARKDQAQAMQKIERLEKLAGFKRTAAKAAPKPGKAKKAAAKKSKRAA